MAATLPPLYEGWVEELLGRSIPVEREATCRDCAMITGRDPIDPIEARGRISFDRVTRCCTYLPDIPNFLVGRILADADPRVTEGRRSVEARLERRTAVTPLGLGRTAMHSLLYRSASDGFGRARALRCPHQLDDGSCGVWPHRMSVCATWFCKHTRGAVGRRFWRALLALLAGIEKDLSRWCLLELQLDGDSLFRLFPHTEPAPSSRVLDRHDLEGTVDPARYAGIWGKWQGREPEFYQKCGRLVAPLDWGEVLAICGPEVRLSARLVEGAFAALRSRRIPERLRAGSFHVHRLTRESALVTSYSTYDPLSLPASLAEALPYFDGRPVGEALRAIEREKRIRLGRDLVRKLVDFGILSGDRVHLQRALRRTTMESVAGGDAWTRSRKTQPARRKSCG